MGGITRVVCAVDIDDPAGSAFGQALAIARRRDARLLLVCAVPPAEPLNRRATERVAYLFRIRREAEAAGIDVHVSVQTGEAAEIVLLHAASRGADLIVAGVEHGRAEGRPWGAVAEDILRSASCPTLVVPAGAPNRAVFHRIVCAVDLERGPAACIEQARGLADEKDHRMTLLHVANGRLARTTLERLQSAIPQDARTRTQARVVAGIPASEIVKATRAADADLLVIGARRRNRMARRLFGVTRELLTSTDCPVLAVPVDAVRRVERKAA